jgi:four helix bundle protein
MAFDASDVAHELVTVLRPVVEKIATRDRALAEQTRRALSSVPLNVDEGRGRHGRDRLYLWSIADGSARELRSVLRVAEGLGYIDGSMLTAALPLLDRELAMLWKMTRGRGPTAVSARGR